MSPGSWLSPHAVSNPKSLHDLGWLMWMGVFLGLLCSHSSITPPPVWAFVGMACGGWVLMVLGAHAMALGVMKALAPGLLWLWAFAAWVLVAELWNADHTPPNRWQYVAAPLGLVLCLPCLVRAFQHALVLRVFMWGLVVLVSWHVLMLPLEALFGVKFSPSGVGPLPREAGPFRYQASGLSPHPTLVAGLYLPLYCVAWGLWRWLAATQGRGAKSGRGLVLMMLALLVSAVCTQSRSALAGSLLACLVLAEPWRWARRHGLWLLVMLGAVAALTWGMYEALFATNKSGLGLRWAYLGMYLKTALHWPVVLWGHGFLSDRSALQLASSTPLSHSHNDMVETLYSWGLPALVCYVLFGLALVRRMLAWCRRHEQWWPLSALLCVLPSMWSDLGIQHMEKAALLVILAALVTALAPVTAKETPGG